MSTRFSPSEWPLRVRESMSLLFHCAIITASILGSFLLRFDFLIPQEEMDHIKVAVLVALAVKLAIYRTARLHTGEWRFAGVSEMARLLVANATASSLIAFSLPFLAGRSFPRSIYPIDFMITFFLTAALRFSVRLAHEYRVAGASRRGKKGLLIYGAGATGLMLLREVRSNPRLGYRVVGFLDDKADRRRPSMDGVPVLGVGRQAAAIVERYKRSRSHHVDEIVIAMPSATGRQMQEALANARVAGVPCKTIPSMGEILTGRVLTKQIRDISVLDLLGREPVRLDETLIRASIEGRSVMLTGAAGSIGSELCRQVASFDPARLVAFEQAESDLFRLQNEIQERFPGINFVPVIGDIRDRSRVEEVIQTNRVQSIFHAAAYKHVPMMESHLMEALKNNVLGTYNLASVASELDCSSFLMISSDKAVNPTNIMGATKHAAELIVSCMPAPGDTPGTRFVCVRFGNVLDSNGSVIPLFKQQIAKGGPVTVTHPEMKRYFMTIPEAVQLVLQASTMGRGSEIFVLDMGEPVYIVDLARNMIRLSGHEPGVDVEIRFTGLRPGEKLFEELVLEGENMLPTYHEKIKIFRGRRIPKFEVDDWIEELKRMVVLRDEHAALRHLAAMVPEYQPTGSWREVLEQHKREHRAEVTSA